MNDSVTKSKRINCKDLGISLFPTNVSSKYYEMVEARRKKWAQEDAENAKQ